MLVRSNQITEADTDKNNYSHANSDTDANTRFPDSDDANSISFTDTDFFSDVEPDSYIGRSDDGQ